MSGWASVHKGSTDVPLSITDKVMEEGTGDISFRTADWVVFSPMLVASVFIGVCSVFWNRKKATTKDYLLGGGNMPPLAVALSLIGGWVSAISILGEAKITQSP